MFVYIVAAKTAAIIIFISCAGAFLADHVLPRIPALERWRKTIQGDD